MFYMIFSMKLDPNKGFYNKEARFSKKLNKYSNQNQRSSWVVGTWSTRSLIYYLEVFAEIFLNLENLKLTIQKINNTGN